MAVLFLLLVFAAASPAQDVRASITGIVTDPAGAPVPATAIRVTNVATNTSVVTESNVAGVYLTPFLTPGRYELTAERAGFKRFVESGIVLQTLDKARIDIGLQLGALADSITVSSTVAALQTETASRSQIISNELINNVPTQGRNPFQIAWAAPGVVKSGGWRYLRSFDIGGTTGFSVNGGRNSENEVLLDGISNVQTSRQVIHVPTMDSVQEFKVLTNTYDAQYGRTGGGIVTIVTKGGSNGFRGRAYEYFQNDKLNANQFELNAGGIKRSPNNINAFGFQLSGPVLIPKVFNGRNKLFWMLAYEGLRQRSADPGVVTVPQMEWRGGDFSSLLNAQGQQVSINDPLTTTAAGLRTPFAGNRIPAARLSKVAVEALKFYPAPTSNGVGPAHIQNYPYPSRWIAGLDQWIGRMDYQINSKNVAYFRYGQNPFNEFRGLTFMTDLSKINPAEPTGNAPLIRNGRNWTFDWTSTISSRLTFDLRAGLSRWEETTGSSYGTGFDQRLLGFDPALAAQFTRTGFPIFDFAGGFQAMGPNRLVANGTNDVYTIQPNVNFVSGRHFFRFGFESRKYNDNSSNPGAAVGSYSFGKNWTQANAGRPDAVSGNELATFLLGYPSSAVADRNIDPAFTHFYYATFFQDDWKITPRLTLNLGLRWDYESPATERYDRMVLGLDFSAASPIAARVQGLNLKGATIFANNAGQGRGSFRPDKNNFVPRAGLAYRFRDKWVFRGGYGLYYLGQGATGSNAGYSQRSTATVSTDGLTPAVNLANAFALLPGGQLLSAIGNSQGASSFLGQALTANYLDRVLPYSHQYSFDIQRELPGSILVEAAYVGNQTRKLPLNAGLNYIPAAELGRRTAAGVIDTAYYTAQVPNPMAGLIPVNAALNGATIQRQILMSSYPQFSGLTIAALPIGKQRYDSLQIKVTKRFARGLTFLGSYTVAKTLEQVSLQNAQSLNFASPASTPLVKQPADQIDIPRKFNFAGVYDLPFGKGKQFANGVPKAIDLFIGGWSANWNITYSKGWAVAYPDAAQLQPGSAKIDNPTIGQWFNTSLWNDANGRRTGAQEAFTLRTFPLRFSDVRLPGYQNWDVSMAKYFPIHESMRLQFRVEAVNAMNHAWFTGIASVNVGNAQFGRLTPSQNNLPRFMKLGLVLEW
ncbi:MAG: TonB-dependent receptor [Candidatus Solibacter usitatus]|nr:TonB-dependent receptor [Candidatus Solibacter usitatus]